MYQFHACENPRALEFAREATRICSRCKGCLVEPGTTLEIRAGDGAESALLCCDCGHDLAGWLRSPPQTHQLEPHGAIGSTAVASMSLA